MVDNQGVAFGVTVRHGSLVAQVEVRVLWNSLSLGYAELWLLFLHDCMSVLALLSLFFIILAVTKSLENDDPK